MTKEVFTQEFKKCFTIYQQVELIKTFITEFEEDFDSKIDSVDLKYASLIETINNQIAIIDSKLESNDTNLDTMQKLVNTIKSNIERIIALENTTSSNTERIDLLQAQVNNKLGITSSLNNVNGSIKWSNDTSGDLSLEITLEDTIDNNVSGKMVVGNYATYMNNHYWTIGIDNDILTIASDVESGMGIRGGTTNDTTYMEMYAGDNKLSIDSSAGLTYNGQPITGGGGGSYSQYFNFNTASTITLGRADAQGPVELLTNTIVNWSTTDPFGEGISIFLESSTNQVAIQLVNMPDTFDISFTNSGVGPIPIFINRTNFNMSLNALSSGQIGFIANTEIFPSQSSSDYLIITYETESDAFIIDHAYYGEV